MRIVKILIIGFIITYMFSFFILSRGLFNDDIKLMIMGSWISVVSLISIYSTLILDKLEEIKNG